MTQTSLMSVFLLTDSCQTPLDTGPKLELNSLPTVSSCLHALPGIGSAVWDVGSWLPRD